MIAMDVAEKFKAYVEEKFPGRSTDVKGVLVVCEELYYGNFISMKRDAEKNLKNRSYVYRLVEKWKFQLDVIEQVRDYEKKAKRKTPGFRALDYTDALEGKPDICEMV